MVFLSSAFSVYFQLGLEHIADLQAYDHIVFIIALCAIYELRDWRRVAILVTAFTIGHSLTLALAAQNLISVPVSLIEFLIPATIFATAIYNVVRKAEREKAHTVYLNYAFALFFGFIHGLGFSNYLKSLLAQDDSLLLSLFSFNLGIEAGQLGIVAAITLLAWIFMHLFKVHQRAWNLFVSGMAAGIALILMMDRIGAVFNT